MLPLVGCHAVLGAQWLRTLGPITWDFKEMVMQYCLNGKQCRLQAVTPEHVDILDTNQFKKEVPQSNQGFMLQLISLQSVHAADDADVNIQKLLEEYSIVFSAPHGLPAACAHDHIIPLLDSSSPVNARPYRYPHYQKNEIEKLIVETLDSSIIQTIFLLSPRYHTD